MTLRLRLRRLRCGGRRQHSDDADAATAAAVPGPLHTAAPFDMRPHDVSGCADAAADAEADEAAAWSDEQAAAVERCDSTLHKGALGHHD